LPLANIHVDRKIYLQGTCRDHQWNQHCYSWKIIDIFLSLNNRAISLSATEK
jgi:hypothetical protein